MNAEEFEQIVTTVLNRTENVLVVKAREYATDADRLHNFKVAAALQGCNPAQALGGMMAKHTVSIFDMIQSGSTYPREVWDEKITDHINYLVLLRAIVEADAQDIEDLVRFANGESPLGDTLNADSDAINELANFVKSIQDEPFKKSHLNKVISILGTVR